VARRSLVAVRDLPTGHRLTASDLTSKRPAGGIPPSDLAAVLGRTLARPLRTDAALGWSDLA
ncbi:MAG: SAF domain-containing protein, partial [Planctomycetota bacterium]